MCLLEARGCGAFYPVFVYGKWGGSTNKVKRMRGATKQHRAVVRTLSNATEAQRVTLVSSVQAVKHIAAYVVLY